MFLSDEKIRGSEIFAEGLAVAERMARAGHAVYFVGGCVRDFLLGVIPKDVDIVTSARPDVITAMFPGSLQIGASFGIITVRGGSHNFEVATFREERGYMDGRHPDEVLYTDDPRIDVLRRDFTINGLLLDPFTGEVVDHVGGVEDLRRGVLRTIGSAGERFSEDYLRMLRAVRFAARFGCGLDDDLAGAVAALAPKLSQLSSERVRDELNKMFTGPRPSEAFRMLHRLGVMRVILPEVADMDGVEQSEVHHPEGDVFEHTALMLDRMAIPSVELAWSIILHDIGKPVCLDAEGHFYNHESEGARMAENILCRLKFSRESTDKICKAVRDHMRFAFVDRMRQSKWRRMMAEENFPMELELHRIDCVCSNGKTENYVLFLDRLVELENTPSLPEPLIRGADLLALGIKPGPRVGHILRKVADMQLEGVLSEKNGALDYVRENFLQGPGVAE